MFLKWKAFVWDRLFKDPVDQIKGVQERERFVERVKVLEGELERAQLRQERMKQELSQKDHDLEVARTVLYLTKRDYAKVEQKNVSYELVVEAKEAEINALKLLLRNVTRDAEARKDVRAELGKRTQDSRARKHRGKRMEYTNIEVIEEMDLFGDDEGSHGDSEQVKTGNESAVRALSPSTSPKEAPRADVNRLARHTKRQGAELVSSVKRRKRYQ
ncbi:hypothetical protein FGB62_181g029 [Gracilaria domingensis]|nr:hypothetical protein FGB62_181g029 [Gracilaria domingensis]